MYKRQGESFVKFLKDYDALQKFEKNITRQLVMDRHVLTVRHFLSGNVNMRPVDFFDLAFKWEKTREGYNYWHDLAVRWRNRCRILKPN